MTRTTVTATVGGDGFNGPSHFTFAVSGDRVARMTIRAWASTRGSPAIRGVRLTQ